MEVLAFCPTSLLSHRILSEPQTGVTFLWELRIVHRYVLCISEISYFETTVTGSFWNNSSACCQCVLYDRGGAVR